MQPHEMFMALDGLHEIRLIGSNATLGPRGYRKQVLSFFPGCVDQVLAVLAYAENHRCSVFYSLNGVDAVPTRVNGKGENYPCAISDRHVSHRSAILLDIDTIKAGDSATDGELELARPTYERVLDWCHDKGYPIRYCMCSGNGRGIVLDADMPANATTDSQVHAMLLHLAATFNTRYAQIDTTVYSRGQVTRLPGTINYKPDTYTFSYTL